MKNDYLYDWVFHFNHHTGLWYGFLREHYNNYFNGMGKDNYLYASSMDKLIKLIKEKNE